MINSSLPPFMMSVWLMNSAANKYIKEVKLNGKILDTLFISHTDIIKGGKLEFIMTDQPVK